jgi:predicted house-cleaning NTP pyrophosphatase (Maf/HAM1 superfamily)
MLMHLRGRTHGVRTGVALSYLGTVTSLEVSATVRMRNFDATTARAYVATGEPLDCAGSYDARAGGAALVEEVSGCLAAVIGFPVLSVATLLRTHASLASVVDPIAACVALCNAPCRAGDPATRHECLPAMTSGSRTPA